MAEILKIGARGSPLSLAQTNLVAQSLMQANPGLVAEVVVIKTTGDKMPHVALAAIGGKGAFAKEIEEALLSGDIDLAVHSAKDLPSNLPEGLVIGAVPQREDVRDVLICCAPGGLKALAPGAIVGTSGLRRQAQILALRPDLEIKPIRGNLATRLQKVHSECEATLLAAAGLNRLGFTPDNAEFMDPEVMLPAVGQGALALEVRGHDLRTLELLAPLNHEATFLALAAERGFLRHFGSGCQMPVAALAYYQNKSLTIEGLVAAADGSRVVRQSLPWSLVMSNSPDEVAELGDRLAREILSSGGDKIMEELAQ